MSTQAPNVAGGCVGNWDKSLPQCKKYDGSTVKAAITSDVKLIVVTVGTGNATDFLVLCCWVKFSYFGMNYHQLFVTKKLINLFFLLDLGLLSA